MYITIHITIYILLYICTYVYTYWIIQHSTLSILDVLCIFVVGHMLRMWTAHCATKQTETKVLGSRAATRVRWSCVARPWTKTCSPGFWVARRCGVTWGGTHGWVGYRGELWYHYPGEAGGAVVPGPSWHGRSEFTLHLPERTGFCWHASNGFKWGSHYFFLPQNWLFKYIHHFLQTQILPWMLGSSRTLGADWTEQCAGSQRLLSRKRYLHRQDAEYSSSACCRAHASSCIYGILIHESTRTGICMFTRF